jgi:hypothetical protein
MASKQFVYESGWNGEGGRRREGRAAWCFSFTSVSPRLGNRSSFATAGGGACGADRYATLRRMYVYTYEYVLCRAERGRHSVRYRGAFQIMSVQAEKKENPTSEQPQKSDLDIHNYIATTI